jgi:CRISPR-associated endonuclease/helicase Cas3
MCEIVPNPERHFDTLKRVRYTLPDGKTTWEEIGGQMAAETQCMAVVNTKNDALALLAALDDSDAMHLSTLLCGAHRREVLARVHERLQSGLPCHLVATQVVEAGVDLDFPVVFRALGPLDRIVQAAGRCNREGKLEYGRVVVFDPAEGSTPPGVYRAGNDVTRRLLQSGGTDLDSPAVHRRYYDEWFRIINQDSKHIQEMRSKLHFSQVAEAFRMIDDDTTPVIVPYQLRESVKDAIAEVRHSGGLSRELIRRLQPYLVGVRYREQRRLEQEGLLLPVTEGLWEWAGRYDRVVGIGRGVADPERLIV